MFNVRLAGDHLHEKWLFTWQSLMMSLLVSYSVLVLYSHKLSWLRSGIELSQFLRISLPTFSMHQIVVDTSNCPEGTSMQVWWGSSKAVMRLINFL